VPGLEIDDIVQETYAKLAALESVEEVRRPKNYFFQTAYSVLVTHVRRLRVVSIRAMDDVDALNVRSDEPSPEKQLDAREQLHRLSEVIALLPEACRRVFVLRRVEGLTQREVAQYLGLSENTVEHHMTRSIHFLMETFGRGGKAKGHSSVGLNEAAPDSHEHTGNKRGD
jgi:RNA polymerase sigma-70 factor (ECF subfamily)